MIPKGVPGLTCAELNRQVSITAFSCTWRNLFATLYLAQPKIRAASLKWPARLMETITYLKELDFLKGSGLAGLGQYIVSVGH
jgi:hypothetical protein